MLPSRESYLDLLPQEFCGFARFRFSFPLTQKKNYNNTRYKYKQ